MPCHAAIASTKRDCDGKSRVSTGSLKFQRVIIRACCSSDRRKLRARTVFLFLFFFFREDNFLDEIAATQFLVE